ncbi:MAG: DNA replication/repair protein RecF [Eubacteriales bacterium]
MEAKLLTLSNFRNVEHASVSFSPGVNIICGDNAQGKTNIIEALGIFASGKSFRAASERDMITFERDWSQINLCYNSSSREEGMSVKYFRHMKKQIKRNGVDITRLSDCFGAFRAVLFTPDHLELVKSSPEHRRRFADMAVCQIKPLYVSLLSRYNKTLEQRNALLKSGLAGEDISATLGLWTERLCLLAGEVGSLRRDYVSRLAHWAPRFYSEMTGGREEMAIEYLSQIGKAEGEQAVPMGRQAVQDAYAALFEAKRGAECGAGVTLCGPHKDDIAITIDGHPARSFGSQGQQRSAVLALKLAEGQISEEECGERAVFLLDDILSELDGGRQRYIIDRLEGRQVVVTSCNSEFFNGVKDLNMIEVKNGTYGKIS